MSKLLTGVTINDKYQYYGMIIIAIQIISIYITSKNNDKHDIDNDDQKYRKIYENFA